MKIKKEGGNQRWFNFKYECLATFGFVCVLMGHADKECVVVYENPDKMLDHVYRIWLRAPLKNAQNQDVGEKWLINKVDGGHTQSSTCE